MALNRYDEPSRKELPTMGDLQDVRAEIQDVRLEVEKVKASIKETELRLIKWQLGGWVALAAIMAKGFGWLGFWPHTHPATTGRLFCCPTNLERP